MLFYAVDAPSVAEMLTVVVICIALGAHVNFSDIESCDITQLETGFRVHSEDSNNRE